MIAVDANILVYAHRSDSEWHEGARTVIRRLAEDRAAWAIPWTCLHEFLGIVTHSRIYDPPTPLGKALEAVDAWLGSPSLLVLTERAGYWELARELIATARTTGGRVHDARVAAVCLSHGVRVLWTSDRDFGRFPALSTENPLLTT